VSNAGKSSQSPKETFEVRVATPEDVQDLLSLGFEIYAENALVTVDHRLAYEEALRAVTNQGSTVLAIGPVGAIEAAMHLTIAGFWYSAAPILQEQWLYVRPEHRRSARAKALMDHAKLLAKNLGIPLLIGVLSNERTQAKIRLYRRQFGEPAGVYFLYNGNTGGK